MFRRVQQDIRGSAIRGGHPSEVRVGLDQSEERHVLSAGRPRQSRAHRRHVHHHEPRVRGPSGTPGKPQGAVQVIAQQVFFFTILMSCGGVMEVDRLFLGLRICLYVYMVWQ